jgi:hypothetical protein
MNETQNLNRENSKSLSGRGNWAYWKEVVKAQKLSGLSQKQYCEQEGIPYSSFRNRLFRLKDGDPETKEVGAFVHAVITGVPLEESAGTIKRVAPQTRKNIEIRYGGLWTIVVPSEFDDLTLGRVMGVIKLHV